jgi:AcrR family transcriptional regulator
MRDTTDEDPQEPADLDIPRGLALAWGVRASPNRGPKRELSIERIVEAGIEIADSEGLGAVSMSAVATHLGYTTMSLYRYVTAKEELLLLMSEQGLGLPPQGIADAVTWQDSIRTTHHAQMEVYSAHPWLLDIPITGTPLTPNNLAWLDAELSGMRRSGLVLEERMAASVMTTGLTRWRAIVERGYRDVSATEGSLASGRSAQAVLSRFVTGDAFPDLADVVASGFFVEDERDEDRTFDFGLERLIDGLALHMARQGRTADDGTGETEQETGSSSPQDDPVAGDQQDGTRQGTEVTQADKDAVEAALTEITAVLAEVPPPSAPKDPAVQKARSHRRDAETAVRTARRAFKDSWKQLRDASKALRDARRSEDDAVKKAIERGRG